MTPDGKHAYVVNRDDSTVSVIDTTTNTVVGVPIPVGNNPTTVAVTPDGKRAYVTNSATSGTVSVIDTTTNTVEGSPIPVGFAPTNVAITPDGKRAYMTNSIDTVTVIDTTTNTVEGSPIPVGHTPFDLAITPDGKRAYVTEFDSSSVKVIDTTTNTVVGNPIPIDYYPAEVAITPDGKRAYVLSTHNDTVSVIDTTTNTVVGSPIQVGMVPAGVAVTPDGKFAYVANEYSQTLSIIDTVTNTVVGTIQLGFYPCKIAITPTASEAGPRLARWKQTTALPKPSATTSTQELTIVGGRAYVFGGQNANNALLTNVYFSTLNADGTLGPWVETTPLPKPPYFDHVVVMVGTNLYLITGANGATAVYYAPILADGSVGQWISTMPLDPSRQDFTAATYGNFIYVAGGNAGGTQSFVKFTSVKPDGSLNPWMDTTPLPQPMQGHALVATHDRLYVVAFSGEAYYAVINAADGTVGPWTPTSSLPGVIPGGKLVVGYNVFELNDYLYLVGGNPNSSYYAKIQSDGSLGDWQTNTLLPATRFLARAGAHNNFVYVAGGYDGVSFFKTVYYSPLAAKVGGSVSGLQVSTESCINNTTSQTVNVANPALSWNCESAGLIVNSKDGIKMTVTGSADLSTSVGGSATGLLLNKVRCINDTTRQAVDIDMSNTPPSWNCETAGLQVNSRDSIRMNINGSAE
ncbi:MAG: beta-propeller fold lactonase family protein [Candidatus Competibacter sp.]